MTRLYGLLACLLALPIVSSVEAQTNYPERPIRIVVGFPPGGPADAVARLLGQKLADSLAKPVVVDNAAGAAGNIATERVAKAAPDGHTLALLTEAQLAINPGLYKLAFDPVKDFSPVSEVAESAYFLVVHNAVPAKSVKELVALSKAQSGMLTFASAGSGSAPHMAAELFKSVAAIDIRHIPYKGVAPAIPDLLGGRVTMMFGPIATALPLVREGKLRALAVTSSRRSSAATDLPTIAESGYPDFEVTGWLGLVAPARTPATITRKLHLETASALALADLRAKLANLGMEGTGKSPDEFTATIKSSILKWSSLIDSAGIKLD